MKTAPRISRMLLLLSALLLVVPFFTPMWRIDLGAPQYPEGLRLQIWLNRITGDVDSINGLNHYIGMKHIKAEMFPELQFLPYAFAGLVVLGLMVTWFNRRWTTAAWGAILGLGLAGAMYDMYRWGYDYGNNLDPTAAIKVEGMAYQPPLIGYKQLLNFEAYSWPDVGGWATFAAFLLAIVAAVLLFRSSQPIPHHA